MKNPKRTHKINPLVTATAQAFAHQNTTVLTRQRELHQMEVQHADEAIENLRTAILAQQRKRAEAQARITGLTLVIERRMSTFGTEQA